MPNMKDRLGRVEVLDVSGSRFHKETASEFWLDVLTGGVMALSLRGCIMPHMDLLCLINHLQNGRYRIQQLRIEDMEFGDMLAGQLSVALTRSPITGVYLPNSMVTDMGCIKLSRTLPLSSVTMLNLSSNSIGTDGVRALAAALPRTRMRELMLDDMLMYPSLLDELYAALPPTLVYLSLAANEISDCVPIAAALQRCPNMTRLNLSDNDISEVEALALIVRDHTSLGKLELNGNWLLSGAAMLNFCRVALTTHMTMCIIDVRKTACTRSERDYITYRLDSLHDGRSCAMVTLVSAKLIKRIGMRSGLQGLPIEMFRMLRGML